MNRAKREWMRREAKRRMNDVWNQPKPSGWFSRLIGKLKRRTTK